MLPCLEDKLLLKEAKDGRFFVKLMYRVLGCLKAIPFSFWSIWNPCVLTNVGFFAWEVSWGKVLMFDQRKRRGRVLANRCFLCEEEGETIEHLLVHCPKAKMLWVLLLDIVGVSWVFPFLLGKLYSLGNWHDSFVGKRCKKVWMVAPLCLFWIVCGERNKLCLMMRLCRFIE